jgi:FkbM family methyltransferase
MWSFEFLRRALKRFPPAIHLYRIVKLVWLDPLNRGRRLHYLISYARWFAWSQPRGIEMLVKLENGMQTRVYADSDSGVSHLFTRNVDFYDNHFVRSQLRPGDFIIDAGCNVGNRTLALADLLGGALLLDANPLCLERLEAIFRLNRLPLDKYTRIAKGVGSQPGLVYLTNLGATHCSNRVITAEEACHCTAQQVELTTIDAELARLGNPACSYIKFDLEGYDLDGLKGAEQTLRGGRVILVKFERWRCIPLQNFLDFFRGINWDVFALDNHGKPTKSHYWLQRNSNLFAARKDHAFI